MTIVKTPQDLGQVIRAQRKRLGLDQAALARQIGVSRQWIIDIEKGKPRAEIGLVLRTLNVLGATLRADMPMQNVATSPQPAKTASKSHSTKAVDINEVVARARMPPGSNTLAPFAQMLADANALVTLNSYANPLEKFRSEIPRDPMESSRSLTQAPGYVGSTIPKDPFESIQSSAKLLETISSGIPNNLMDAIKSNWKSK
jgi:y4mF family transcriptional regulator